jgi:hypothetical protein
MLVVAMVAVVVAVGSVDVRPARAAWGPETPPFNLQVILRDVADGDGFGLVKFRQPNDADQIVELDTWITRLEPDHDYVLRRAVDAPDGVCTSTAWLTLGRGLDPQPVTTDAMGTGRAALFRSLAVFAPGTRFDIRFQIADAATLAPILESACYQFAVSV